MVILSPTEYEKNPYYLKPGESIPDYNARVAAFNAAKPTAGVTPSTSATPTGNPIVDSGIRRHVTPTPGAGYAGVAADYFSGVNIKAPDEAAQQQIKDQSLRDVQAQIDSIDKDYAARLQEEAIRATGREGQGRSINARSGLLESDMGAQREKGIEDVNAQARDAIVTQRENAKTAIFSKAADRAQAKIEMETTKALTNAGNYLTFLKGQQEEARANLATLSKVGVSLNDLSDKEYSMLLDQSGYTPEQAHAIQVLNKPVQTVLTSFTQGNKYYVITQDPITNARKTDVLDLGFTVPVAYNSQKLDDGTMVFFPEKFDAAKPIKDQILTYGVQSESSKLDIANKKANLQKTYAEIAKLKSGGEDPVIISDLQGAAAAIDAGADPDKVRQRFLDSHPAKGDLYLKYTKQAY